MAHQWVTLEKDGEERFYVRFTSKQRIMHFIMILSFFTLAITGMILKFSYMGWAQLSASLLGGFPVTGTLHRMAALALIAIWLGEPPNPEIKSGLLGGECD